MSSAYDKEEYSPNPDVSTAEKLRRTKEMVYRDLKNLPAGKTYNQAYEEEYQSNVKAGILSKDAKAKHRAYEMETPKNVRGIVDSDKAGAGQGSRGKDAGELGKKWSDTFNN